MMMTQRYPDSFDGVIAGAPAFNFTGAAVAGAWNTAQVAAIAPRDADGRPDLARALSDADLRLLSNGVLRQCDELDTDPVRIGNASKDIDALSADLSEFHKRGGKLLLYMGMSDAALSANDLINYYEKVAEASGGMMNAWKFARLFLLPGVCHCGGGSGLDEFDALTAIENWVEKGTPPASIVASGPAFPGRARPLCPYPQIPCYKGTGGSEDAANFECRQP